MEYEVKHVPVLMNEVREGLNVTSGMVVVDGTLGDGGHSNMLCEAVGESGLVIGIDRDPEAVKLARARLQNFGARFSAVQGNFSDLPDLVSKITDRPVDRVLLDLGWSMTQFTERGRGFSFLLNEPLDMRFDTTEDTPTAADIVNHASRPELIRILRQYGEENNAEKIVEAVLEAREHEPITTTQQLAHVITRVVPRYNHMHPATQVFQALRIAVNDELETLRRTLDALTKFLPAGARVAVITFHSLEDRIVKQFIQSGTVTALTKKPIMPTEEEKEINPRCRSSKLRIFEI